MKEPIRRWNFQRVIAVILCIALIPLWPVGAVADESAKPLTIPSGLSELWNQLEHSYLELFRISPHLHFDASRINEMRDFLKNARDHCQNYYKDRTKKFDSQLKETQQTLREETGKISDEQRHEIHCRIQQLRRSRTEDQILADHAIPIAYENKNAKLNLIQQWPQDLKQIDAEIANGSYINRRWGDVKDIGFRVIASGQQDDIKTGQQAVEQMKQSGIMPPVVKDPAVVDYVDHVAQTVAAHSDLHVPLHVTVLNSKEINAFSLPGGYLFVERGLLEATDDEAELAGVMGHEIGHVVARHGHKLMEKATIAGIFYQAAEVAAMILTGGVMGIGTYYALQYGFYGLGLVLNLKLLGVSREFELQADQLGIQYAWNSDYDPTGFIRFFDKMATHVGYVNGVGWFMDHPPFYTRMVDAMREIMFLPKKPKYIVTTTAFEQMKQALKKVTAKAEENEKNKPSLYGTEQGCATQPEVKYKAGEPIEQICPILGVGNPKSH